MTPLARFLSDRLPRPFAAFCLWGIYMAALALVFLFSGHYAADMLYLDMR